MRTGYYLLCIVLLGSCVSAYVPNLRNAPTFTKGGEFQGSVQMLNGADVQTAVSLTSNIALMGNASYGMRGSSFDEGNYHRHQLFEGAVGYYKNYGRWSFQMFGGYGMGRAEGRSTFLGRDDVPTIAKFERYFAQPAFVFHHKQMTMAIAPRFSYLDFYHYTDPTTMVNYSRSDLVFFEPAFITNLYFAENRAFITMQVGLAGSFRDEKTEPLEYRFFTTGVGFGLRLGGLKDLAGENR